MEEKLFNFITFVIISKFEILSLRNIFLQKKENYFLCYSAENEKNDSRKTTTFI